MRFDSPVIKKLEKPAVALYILVYSFVLMLPSSFYFSSNRTPFEDSAVYQYMARLILNGRFPYLDAFDHKGILLYFLYAIGYSINPLHGQWIIDYLFMAGTLLFMFLIAKHYLNTIYSIVISFCLCSDIILFGYTPDFYSTFLIAVCVYLLLPCFEDKTISRKSLLLIGFCTSCVCCLKHVCMLPILILCFIIIVRMLAKKQFREVGKYLLFFIIGFVPLCLAAIIYLAINGALLPMFDCYFLYNFIYGNSDKIAFSQIVNAFKSLISTPVLIVALLTSLAVILSKRFISKQKLSANLVYSLIALAITIILTIAFLALPGVVPYYYIVILIPLILALQAIVIKELVDMKFKYQKLIRCALMIILFVVPAAINLSFIPSYCSAYWNEAYPEQELTNYINEVTSPDDSILVVGFSLELYNTTDKYAPGRWFYTVRYMPDEYHEELCDSVIDNKPKMIITHQDNDLAEILSPEVMSNYELIREYNYYKVYILKG